jgi:hypothetical protein
VAADETRVEAEFADGEYVFWLPLIQVAELERTTGTPMLAIEESLRPAIGKDVDDAFHFTGGGAATVKQIREVIRLALIGGNDGMVDGEKVEMGPHAAKHLVDAYVYPARPLGEGAVLAWRILHGAIFGVRLKKAEVTQEDQSSPSEKDS